MKKLLTLMTLLVMGVTGAWATDVTVGRTYTLTTSNTKPTTYTMNSVTNATVTQSDGTVSMATGTQTIKVGATSYSSTPKEVCYRNHNGSGHVKSKDTDVYAGFKLEIAEGYQLTVSSIDLAVGSTANFSYQMEIVDNNGQSLWTSSSYTMTNYDNANVTNGSQSLSPTTTLVLTGTVYARLYYWYNGTGKYIVPTNFSIDGNLEVASSNPTLTGAWKIGDDEVTSVNVVQGGSVTIPTFTVGATSGTPDADDYTVTYSLKDGSATNIFTFTESGGPTEISTANVGTATLVATLASIHTEEFEDADPNTFEYTVTVNAPAAPTFSPDASAVVSGTEITMTSPDGGEIWYTTNGEDPTESNKTVYNEEAKPTITGTTTIKAIARVNGYSSAVTTADYTIIAMLTQNSVSTSRTWDWSKLSAVGMLTDVTNPTNAEDFVMANMDGVRYPDFNLGFNSNFTQEMAQEIVISNTQYVKRDGGGNTFQNGTIKINFAVPGKLTVYFTGTSGSGQSGDNARYLVVNDEKGSVGTNNTEQKNETFDVVVGDNTIGFESGKPLRIQKLVFVEAVPVEVSALGYATFASDEKLDFTGTSISAYKATVTDTTVDFTQVNVVPAGEGVLLYAAGGATVNVPVTTADADDFAGNKLVRGTGDALTYAAGTAEYYILANETAGIGFYKAKNNTVATNRAYLDLTGTGGAKSFVLPGSETDGIRSIENSELRIENSNYYNLAGQRVGKDYKGIVIVNGKKMLNK